MAMSVPYTMASTGYQVNHCCLSRSFLKGYFNVLICISQQHIFTYFFISSDIINLLFFFHLLG